MAKTSEEILKHWGINTNRVQCSMAMEEFAAQEVKKAVDAYKDRLKDEMHIQFYPSPDTREFIKHVIDAVK